MELIRALGELAEAPGAEQVRTARMLDLPGEPLRSEYSDLFVVQLYPYASVYLSPDGQLGGEVQEHIAGFWRVLRQPVPRDPDHIATLFATYAQLAQIPQSAHKPFMNELGAQMRHAFLWEHIMAWLLPFLVRVRELGSPVYRAWAMLAMDAFEAEVARAGVATNLPLQLRNAPPLSDDTSASGLADAMFAPVCSGCILTRADLARCARDLGMSVRVADRRYTLAALIERDRTRVCAWLSTEAARQAELVRATPHVFSGIAAHWESRALRSAALLARAAMESPPLPQV